MERKRIRYIHIVCVGASRSKRTSSEPNDFQELIELRHNLLDELARRACTARARVQNIGQVNADARDLEVVRHGPRQPSLLEPFVESLHAHPFENFSGLISVMLSTVKY